MPNKVAGECTYNSHLRGCSSPKKYNMTNVRGHETIIKTVNPGCFVCFLFFSFLFPLIFVHSANMNEFEPFEQVFN